jgi:hypothetical protein
MGLTQQQRNQILEMVTHDLEEINVVKQENIGISLRLQEKVKVKMLEIDPDISEKDMDGFIRGLNAGISMSRIVKHRWKL